MSPSGKEEEDRTFAAIAQELARDKLFLKNVSKFNNQSKRKGSPVLSFVVFGIGLALMVFGIGVLSGIIETLSGVAGFVIMILGGVMYVSTTENHGEHGERVVFGNQRQFMAKMEHEWEERRHREGMN